jgi:hypothetical protein
MGGKLTYIRVCSLIKHEQVVYLSIWMGGRAV